LGLNKEKSVKLEKKLEERGMSVAELAAETGISQRVLRDIIDGNRGASGEQASDITESLETKRHIIFVGEKDEFWIRERRKTKRYR
jgi:predicted transcriptional regulator